MDMVPIAAAAALITCAIHAAKKFFQRLRLKLAIRRTFIPYPEVVPGWYVAVDKHGRPLALDHSNTILVMVEVVDGKLLAWDTTVGGYQEVKKYIYLRKVVTENS